jgi:hypothetical protein
MKAAPIDSLLRSDALRDVRIAISASDSPDLLRLGLVETHFRLALAEIARSVLVSGGKLAYGGHLDPNGYTAMLVKELQRYGRRDRSLRIYLAWQEHRKLSKQEFDKQVEDLGLSGEIVCLDIAGKPIAWGDSRGNDPEPVTDAHIRMQALSALRVHMAQHENGRVIIGGKRIGFQGIMPGVLQEAIASVANGQPLYVAGGFGGVAADIAKRIELLGANWLPELADAPAPEASLIAGLDELSSFIKDQGWPANGLSDAENAQLAATHRPSEIAALVSLGLGRQFSKSK